MITYAGILVPLSNTSRYWVKYALDWCHSFCDAISCGFKCHTTKLPHVKNLFMTFFQAKCTHANHTVRYGFGISAAFWWYVLGRHLPLRDTLTNLTPRLIVVALLISQQLNVTFNSLWHTNIICHSVFWTSLLPLMTLNSAFWISLCNTAAILPRFQCVDKQSIHLRPSSIV